MCLSVFYIIVLFLKKNKNTTISCKMKFLLSFLLFPSILVSQNEEQHKKFDSIFYDTAVRVAAIDIAKASKIADSLYKTSTTELNKLKSLMLSADLLEKQSKREESIAYVLKADSIASTIENYEWQARISGFLSTQYRIIGLIDQGRRYLDKGLEASEKIKPQSVSNQYTGMIYQEMAHYAIYEENYTKAVAQLKKATPFFNNMKSAKMKNFFFGNNEEMLGRSYLGLKDYSIAKQHYIKALMFLNKAESGKSQWAGMVFHGLGKIALEFKNYNQALCYLQKADSIAGALNHLTLKQIVYRDLGEYYKMKRDFKKYILYNTKYLNMINKNIKSERAASNGELNRIYKEKQLGFSKLNKIIIAISVLLVFSMFMFYFNRRKSRIERQNFNAIIERLNAPTQEEDIVNTELKKTENQIEKRFMPEETEKRLLNELENFEKEKGYLNPDISLSALAVNLHTNTKYLSYVINTHKKKDFNNYINEARIFYIIKIINSSPEHLNYKISYLSEKCGFSSHSKFTTVFKNTTGLTPSAFLNQIRVSHDQNDMYF